MKIWLDQHIFIPVNLKIKRKNLRTRNIKMLVIDEADEMLNKGFQEQIYDIYRYLPPTTQVSISVDCF